MVRQVYAEAAAASGGYVLKQTKPSAPAMANGINISSSPLCKPVAPPPKSTTSQPKATGAIASEASRRIVRTDSALPQSLGCMMSSRAESSGGLTAPKENVLQMKKINYNQSCLKSKA